MFPRVLLIFHQILQLEEGGESVGTPDVTAKSSEVDTTLAPNTLDI